MIPLITLLNTINDFDSKFKEIEAKCDASTKGGEEHLHWYKMHKAYLKLQNIVEIELLPFVE